MADRELQTTPEMVAQALADLGPDRNNMESWLTEDAASAHNLLALARTLAAGNLDLDLDVSDAMDEVASWR